MLMSRHAFLGTGQYGTKWLGEFESQWDDLRRSIVATVEMNMFGFSMVSFIYLFFLIVRFVKLFYSTKYIGWFRHVRL